MNKIAIYLNRHITGNVFDKDSVLEAYSTDRSMLKIKPRFVAVPETTSDIRKLVKFVNQLSEKKYELPIAVRGSGLSKTGSDLTKGIVISTEKMNHIRELDAHDRLIHVQSGMTLGKLNAILAPHGLYLPIHADPRETIGGLINNCAKDKFSQKYGGIMNYVDRIEVVLSNGDLIQTSRINRSKLKQKIKEKSLEGKIYKKIYSTIEENTEYLSKRVESREGYFALKHVARNNNRVYDLMPIFFGAEGNLGIITEIILRCDVLPSRPHRLFATFSTYKSAAEFAEYCKSQHPLYVSIYDNRVFKNAEEYGKKPDLLTKKIEDGYTVLASFNDKKRKARLKVRKCLKFLPKSATVIIETTANSADFDDFETSINLYLNDSTNEERPNLLTDFYVPNSKMQHFLKDIKNLEKISKKHLELIGDYNIENYSFRPVFNLEKIDERRTAITLLRDLNEIIEKNGGKMNGGYPEGRLKAIITCPKISKKEKKITEEIKEAFDKNNIFSPETKTNYDTRSAIRHLRTETLPGIIT